MLKKETQEHSFADLIRNLRDETTTLMRQEVALAKTEMSEKVGKAGRNVAYAVIGGAIAHLALIFLLLAASGGIEVGLTQTEFEPHRHWIAPLVIGLVVGAIGAGLLLKAKSSLSNLSMTPERTIKSIKEDTKWIQEKVA